MEKRLDKGKSDTKRIEDIKYCRTLKEFLKNFKTKPCIQLEEHNPEYCLYYHSPQDKRRNPYTDAGFLYYLDQECYCKNQNCPNYHTHYEYIYHPHIYKTTPCTRNQCDAPPNVCWMLHKGQSSHFQQGQFFRFDITTFKTVRCTRTDHHDRKVCLGFHYEKDRRRPNFQDYSHIPCSKSNCDCERSHNKIEQLYHPTRYKTKFCQHFGKDPSMCEYRDFCSFAHTKEEILINLIDPDNKDANYKINTFKTVWCPYTQDHKRNDCPYAHNIQDYRRNPNIYHYEPVRCSKWDFDNKIQSIEASECPQGMNCNKCHGWMQLPYHPKKYGSKSLQKTYVKKQDVIDKKLKDQKDRKDKQKAIEVAINKDLQKNKAIFSVGAPFFKSQREYERDLSNASNPTKPKSSNISSQNSLNLSNNNQKAENKVNPNRENHINSKISSVFFQSEEHQMWQYESIQNYKSRNSDGRSKSQGTSSQYEQSYSRSIKDLVNDSVIIKKLYNQKVNEVNLIHMSDVKVNDMEFLSKDEKEKLHRKLKQYHLIKSVDYSKQLTNLFAVNNAEKILSKLRLRKFTEQRILKLTRQAVKQIQFLSNEEKDVLSKLLRIYEKGKEFYPLQNQLEEFINKQTSEVGDH